MCNQFFHPLFSLTTDTLCLLSFFYLLSSFLHLSHLDYLVHITKSSFNLCSTHPFFFFYFLCFFLCLLIPVHSLSRRVLLSHIFLSFSFVLLARINQLHSFLSLPFLPLLFSFSPHPPASSCPSLTSVTPLMKSESGACFPALSFASPSLHHRCCRGSCRLYNLWMPQ